MNNRRQWLCVLAGLLLVMLAGCEQRKDTPPAESALQTPQLFAVLPDCAPTPDGMAVAPDGDLVVACPNFADVTKPGCLLRINKQREIRKWVDVAPLAETKRACPMGIAFGPDGDLYVCDNQGWPGKPEGQFKGRILRLRIKDNAVVTTTVVAQGMEHPNGVRVQDGCLYVTQSLMTKVKDASGLLVSAVYRFKLDDEGILAANTLDDKNIVTTFLTQNKDCQYGADGLVFDKAGRLYVGNFGDGAIHRIVFGKDGKVVENKVWAKDAAQMRTTDGICMDKKGNIYVADFSENAVAVVTPDARVRRLAKSPDSDGSKGELDQPGEPIVWDGKLVVTCFDIVTGPDKVNTKHDKPFTMSCLKLIK
jgi:sugar lactone lactonase YvrE